MDLGVEDEEITVTPFRATVSHTTPFTFVDASQNIRSSVRLCLASFVPPTAAELSSYRAAHSTALKSGPALALLKLKTLAHTGKVESYVLAAFPVTVTADAAEGYAMDLVGKESVCRFSEMRLDVDQSVAFEVDGPGQVVLYGEQLQALIPDWKSHNMFGREDRPLSQRKSAGDAAADDEDDEGDEEDEEDMDSDSSCYYD